MKDISKETFELTVKKLKSSLSDHEEAHPGMLGYKVL